MTTHENLREWMGANKVYFKDLARLVHVASLSYYLKAPGKLFPPEWIETWGKAYGWSDRETFLFQYERPFLDPGEHPSMYGSPINLAYENQGFSTLLGDDLNTIDMKPVRTMAHMYEGCSVLSYVTPPSKDNWPKCIYDVSYMFNGCEALESVDVSFINFSDRRQGGLGVDNMFKDCLSLRHVYVRSEEDARALESCRAATGMPEDTKILVQGEA